jgi:Flp pilus assembly protein TadD
LLVFACGAAFAVRDEVESAPVNDANYQAGVNAVDRRDWPTAVERLEEAARVHGRSADVFNLLGYAYRHTGELERSFESYFKALELDPTHRGVHEYIGEAYLLRGDVVMAERHLKELQNICGVDCAEYLDLANAIRDYRTRSPH